MHVLQKEIDRLHAMNMRALEMLRQWHDGYCVCESDPSIRESCATRLLIKDLAEDE